MLVGCPASSGLLVGCPEAAGLLVGCPASSGLLVGCPGVAGLLVACPASSGLLVGCSAAGFWLLFFTLETTWPVTAASFIVSPTAPLILVGGWFVDSWLFAGLFTGFWLTADWFAGLFTGCPVFAGLFADCPAFSGLAAAACWLDAPWLADLLVLFVGGAASCPPKVISRPFGLWSSDKSFWICFNSSTKIGKFLTLSISLNDSSKSSQ